MRKVYKILAVFTACILAFTGFTGTAFADSTGSSSVGGGGGSTSGAGGASDGWVLIVGDDYTKLRSGSSSFQGKGRESGKFFAKEAAIRANALKGKNFNVNTDSVGWSKNAYTTYIQKVIDNALADSLAQARKKYTGEELKKAEANNRVVGLMVSFKDYNHDGTWSTWDMNTSSWKSSFNKQWPTASKYLVGYSDTQKNIIKNKFLGEMTGSSVRLIVITSNGLDGLDLPPSGPVDEKRTFTEQKTETFYNYKWSDAKNTETLTCDHTVYLDIRRQITGTLVDENGIPKKTALGITQTGDPIGENNLNSQPTVATITPFGKMYDQILAKGSAFTAADWTKLKTACDQTKSWNPTTVDLNQQNKDGLAEGGVLNVIERKRTATAKWEKSERKMVSCSKTTKAYKRSLNQTRTKATPTSPWSTWTPTTMPAWTLTSNSTQNINNPDDCITQHKADKGKTSSVYTAGTLGNPTPSKTTIPVNPATNPVPSKTQPPQYTLAPPVYGTPQEKGFWQIIAVHCNPEDYKNAMNAADGAIEVSSQADASGYLTKVAYSKTYQRTPSNMDFGNKTNPNAALKRTGDLGFYNKECAFECVADKSTSGSTNGSNKNIRNASPADGANGSVGDGWGAVSENVNNNSFDFFRDNIDKEIKLDVWYPKSVNGVKYDNHGAKTTTITKWNQGTPNGSQGGKFVMTDKNNRPVFKDNGNDNVPNQSNWNTKTFTGKNISILSGTHNEFKVRADWASEDGYPHVLNVKWEYAPKIDTKVATTGIGFKANGVPARDAANIVSMPIQGKCYAQFGGNTAPQLKADFQNHTGSDKPNGLDKKLPEMPNMTGGDKDKLYIKFVRSTTE